MLVFCKAGRDAGSACKQHGCSRISLISFSAIRSNASDVSMRFKFKFIRYISCSSSRNENRGADPAALLELATLRVSISKGAAAHNQKTPGVKVGCTLLSRRFSFRFNSFNNASPSLSDSGKFGAGEMVPKFRVLALLLLHAVAVGALTRFQEIVACSISLPSANINHRLYSTATRSYRRMFRH